jgi:hypothetical protein
MMAAAYRRVGGISSPYRLVGTGSLALSTLWLDTNAAPRQDH